MAESHVVTALISKLAELAGLIEHHQKEMVRRAGEVAHLDATFEVYSPEIDLRMIRAKALRTRSRFFLPGECQRRLLDIFRNAQGTALSSRQISTALAARKGLEPATAMIEQIPTNAIAVVHRLQRTRTLIAAGQDGRGGTWSVAGRVGPSQRQAFAQPVVALPVAAPISAHQQALAYLVQEDVGGRLRYVQTRPS